jgi:RNA polymerase sigma-70 factor (ECF subfamily)
VFIALHNEVLEHGFVCGIKEMLSGIIRGKSWNHWRARDRSPITTGLPSSGSMKPVSQDVERALHFQKLARRLFSLLSPGHQDAIEMIYVRGLTHTDAAAALGIPEGTLKTRLRAALSALEELAKPLTPSERGPL